MLAPSDRVTDESLGKTPTTSGAGHDMDHCASDAFAVVEHLNLRNRFSPTPLSRNVGQALGRKAARSVRSRDLGQ
jgi:hypothetical protein